MTGNTTLTGDLVVSGSITPGTVIAGSSISAPYFTATSTTATSTFAGRLAIGTTTPWGDGFFTVGTSTPLLHISSNTGNIGIGTMAQTGSRLSVMDTSTQLRLNYDASNSTNFTVSSDGALSISPTNFATTTIANALALTMPKSYFLNN
ncbi:MAG: hypothetical protein Q8O70_00740, partial [Burkholderiales bacterium]|nr:hypothetical protein [Burkholderiales bacterium]